MAGYLVPALASCFVTLVFIVNGDDDHGSNALSYDADTFQAGLEKNRNFVMFYAPWCGHCKNLAPTWDELAKLYNKAEDSPVIIAKVDCTVHTGLCADHDVVGFPTLKLFEAGGENYKRYSGKRDLDSLKSFIQEQVQGEGSQDSGSDKEEKKPEVPEPKGSLVVLTDENFQENVATGYAFVKFYAPWCGHCKRLAPTWDDLANGFSDDDKVAIAKIDCTQSSVVCKQFEIRGYPTLLWFKDGKKVDQYQGQRTHEALKRFVSDKMAEDSGEEVRGQEEEKVPETVESVEGKVQDLTVDNFHPFVSSKLVFVKFYAPWCGHCKRLAPTWEDLAKESKDLPVSIAKVDCTQHKSLCEEFQVRGYPTLKVFNKGEFVKDYKGGRDLDALYSFVKKQIEIRDEL